MSGCILACATLKRELNAVMKKLNCSDPVIYLDAGDHNVPQRRRDAIEKALADLPTFDTVVLAMSFCGGALNGINSGDRRLLLPCFDDCIGLLLDKPRQPDTYYLTEGWLEGKDNIVAEYRNSLEKYGEARTKRIFSAMFRGYRQLAYLDTGCGTSEGIIAAKEAARLLNLDFTVIPGTLSRLEDLLTERETAHILKLPPDTAINQIMRTGMAEVTVLPQNRTLFAYPGENLLHLLRRYDLAPNAPCGGQGTCGKCVVNVDGQVRKACGCTIEKQICVTLPEKKELNVLHEAAQSAAAHGPVVAAVDLGTTSVVCSLMDKTSGQRLAVRSCANPQAAYGADVVTRIRAALSGHMDDLTRLIREAVGNLLLRCCTDAGLPVSTVQKVCIVGNPAMEQMFLGISPENLVQIPFQTLLKKSQALPCCNYLPVADHCQLLVTPNISAYVGSDTVGCVMAAGMNQSDRLTLLVDIGTNGEMVLGSCNRLVATSTAAGPALEGANIRFGMPAQPGAINLVWLEGTQIRFSTIADAAAVGICGSGLIDAVAVFLKLGKINRRGRISPGEEMDGQRILRLSEQIYLTQEDIRQVQLAKGAIHAGIRLMMKQLNVTAQDIDCCLLAGAFGNFLNPESACRIGLLPPELRGKIQSIGNAAARGAERMALDESLFLQAENIAQNTLSLELSALPEFPRTYAKAMGF